MPEDRRDEPLGNDETLTPPTSEVPAGGRRLSDLTVDEFRALTRGPGPQREAGTPETAARLEIQKSDSESVRRAKLSRAAVEAIGASPTDVQVCFLEGLAASPEEAERFMDAPVEYATEHGVVLDPELVHRIVNSVVFGKNVQEELGSMLSVGALRDVARMRGLRNACVMGAANTVVVEAANGASLVVGTKALENLAQLKGLGPKGIRLPGGRAIRFTDGLNFSGLTAVSLVAVYGATTLSAQTVAVADVGSGFMGRSMRGLIGRGRPGE